MKRDPTDLENSIMGCMGSATTVCIMIPMDTVKTRLVTQANYPDLIPYNGIVDCAKRIAAEEGTSIFPHWVNIYSQYLGIKLIQK